MDLESDNSLPLVAVEKAVEELLTNLGKPNCLVDKFFLRLIGHVCPNPSMNLVYDLYAGLESLYGPFSIRNIEPVGICFTTALIYLRFYGLF